jgi:hypothetical protein
MPSTLTGSIRSSSPTSARIRRAISGWGDDELLVERMCRLEREADEVRERRRYVGTFRTEAGAVDAVSNTEGIEVTNALGPGFGRGVFVAQDGDNAG